VSASSFATAPGAAGLSTSRLTCSLTAPADLSGASTVDIDNRYRADRIGWRELTATAHGVHLVGSPLPAQSVSGGLTAYPQDLLSSPLDVRSAHLRVEPGDGPSTQDTAAAPLRTGTSWLNGGSWLAGAEQTLRGWVAERHVTPFVGVLAVLLALALGAAHAALPGHGKTVMAAYLAGRHGRPRDALAVGATVTLTHTGGVLALGLLLTTVAGLAGERILSWLGVASGALIAVLGAAMLIGLRRRLGQGHSHSHGGHGHSHGGHGHSHGLFGRRHTHDPGSPSHAPGPHVADQGPASDKTGAALAATSLIDDAEGDHGTHHDRDGESRHEQTHAHLHDGEQEHGHPHAHSHDGEHSHVHQHGQEHDHGHSHGHQHEHASKRGNGRAPSRLSIISMGVAGGLVPSPSALVILLGAIGLGRTGFGVLLVVGYGVGMAATLTAAGLLLIRLQDRWSKRLPRLTARLSAVAPAGTATLVLLVGLGLAGRAFAGL
jgi:ABC-type nickel/cobalt efflux system permease component RcnA